MPYPHDMGHAEKIWEHEINISNIGQIKVMGAVEAAYLDPASKGKPQWIASVTFSVYVKDEGGTHGGSSGYLFTKWRKTKEEAIALVLEHKHYQTKMSY